MPAKVSVSVLIPILNEAGNLPRCLDSVRWADEVFVVDSGSTDGSQRIAEERGARVVQFEFNGIWPKKKNWALEHLSFKHEWVFILDADEVLPPETEAEFRAIVSDPGHAVAGYWINRRFMFMGDWLRHAYYPNWNLRLLKHRLGRYEKLTDVATQSGDNEVHEHIVIQGLTGRLKCEMDHYAFPSVEVFVEKHNRYSNWEARVALDRYLQKSAGRLQSKDVGLRRLLKQLSQRLPCRPLLRFFYVYVWQRGFLDGRRGYYFARLHGFYEFLSVAKTFELQTTANRAGISPRKSYAAPFFLTYLTAALYFALVPVSPPGRLQELPRPVANWLNAHDDLANFAVFAVLGFLALALPPAAVGEGRFAKVRAALSDPNARLALLVALVVGLELAQLTIPGRVCDWPDLATGSAGVLCAWLIHRATR